MEYDVIILNGKIYDGTGNPWFYADIGILNGKIETIGKLKNSNGKYIIDALGLAVSPGFIDIHSHSDFTLLVDPRGLSKIHQGVTTEIVGNCGSSAAPMNDFLRDYREKYLKPMFNGLLELDWNRMREYFVKLEEKGIALNVASHVGHGTVRSCVMGYDQRKPTGRELDEMKELVAEAMEDGAVGMSTGLIYPPSCYAETEELIELAKVVAEFNGIYASHIRGEGETLLEAVREAIMIGEKASLPVEISHFKASGKENWGKVHEAAKLIEEARMRGVDVTADQYPYIASSTGLSALLPRWAHEGGAEKLLERLKNPDDKRRMEEYMKRYVKRDPEYWSRIVISSAKKNPQFEGKTVKEISEILGKDPVETVFHLLIEEETMVQMVSFGMCEEDVEYVMKLPWVMVGSDGLAVSPEGVLGKGKPHPRYYGTFPRVLGIYVRERNILRLSEAIRKMTYLPAWRLGFRDRGIIREGAWADIVIFNPEKIIDAATFMDPHKFARGINYVLVNGKIVIDKGKYTGELPGKVLRKMQI
ncbi:MAG: D-aminoacylase [archaeon GB-1845-036]|nr:D-aminoacylase [Candidatus Culexmicrobium thermophilum]